LQWRQRLKDYEPEKMGVIKVRKDVTNTARQIFGNSEGSDRDLSF
jgi:hypothetical protein